MKKIFYTLLSLLYILPLSAQWAVFTPDIPDTVGVSHVFPASPDVVWALAMQYDVTPTGFELRGAERAYFFRTTNAGDSWSAGLVPMGAAPYLSSIHATGPDTAWVVGVDLAGGESYVLKTTNGGTAWNAVSGIPFTDFQSWPNFIHFQDAMNGVLMSDPTPSPSNPVPHFEIYRTADGGNQWTRVSAGQIPAALFDEFGVAAAYDAIGDHIWFGTSSGRIFSSRDGGASWESTDTGVDFINFVSFSDTLTGIVATPPFEVSLTEDGGQTWTDITPPGEFTFFVSAAMVPESEYVVLVTADNFVSGPFTTLISPDKGATWLEIGSGEEAGSANFLSPSVGFAGEWQPADHKTRLYTYNGTPLSGLLSGKALDVKTAVFPNPVQDILTVSVTDSSPAEYLLLLNDMNGRLLARQKHRASGDWTAAFDMRSLPAGSYVLTIANQQGALSRMVVKQ